MTNYKFNTENFGIPTGLAKQLIGFDTILEQIRNAAETMPKIPTYPPYNIRKVSDDKYVIEMAVAGFAKTDIEVTLEGNTLVVKGNTSEAENEYDYIFKGIANRNFMRSFTIADKIEIKDAQLVNGMLSIFLENIDKPIPAAHESNRNSNRLFCKPMITSAGTS